MNQQTTQAIVLSRTDYGEADRIVTFLTPEFGKLRLMARGARKVKSKLAGGIELFSVSDLTFIYGRGEVGTLISSRLRKHYGQIVQDINSVQLGYELIKFLNKVTADHPEREYFDLLRQTLEALNDAAINLDLIDSWFKARLLSQGGHAPNLTTDASGQPLTEQTYNFDFDKMAFRAHSAGRFNSSQIKFLRLLFSQKSPVALNRVSNLKLLIDDCRPLLQTISRTYTSAS